MCEANVARLRRRAFWVSAAVTLSIPVLMVAQAPPAGAPQGAPAQPGAAAPGGGQGRGRGGQGNAPAAGRGGRAGAPVDLTGYWVSLVTEDWIERMSPDSPRSGTGGAGGGFGGGGGGGRGGAPAAAPAAPTSSDPCRVYGAGGSLRVPGRLHITWADDNTMKVEMDSGTQTRLFHFNVTQPEAGPRSLQGYSIATWDTGGGGGFGGFGGGGGRGGGGGGGRAAAPRWGSLKVVTTNLTGGYLLSSRNTYGENATLTENFTRHTDFGVDYFTVTAMIEENGQNRITSSTFKKEADGSKFSPAGCEVVK